MSEYLKFMLRRGACRSGLHKLQGGDASVLVG